MIRLNGVSFSYRAGGPVFSGLDLEIPSDRRVAVLGHKESGKSTLVSLLAGLVAPSSGRIDRHCRLSFPGGFQGGFRLTHSGRQNIMFAANIYDADPLEVLHFVRAVTGLGDALEGPLRSLSFQNRVSLSYALTYALPFDTYLFDNTIASVGSGLPEFQSRCRQMYEGRTRDAGSIVATRQPRTAEQFCDCAFVIRGGDLVYFETVRDAITVFEADAAEATTAAALAAENGAESSFLAEVGN